MLREVMVGIALVACDKPAARPPCCAWQPLGAHPQAAMQPTEVGRTLRTLCPFRGQLYIGYGDYGENTGPIAVTAWDPAHGVFATVHTSDTEAIYNYRAIGDALYAPATDRREHADYAVGPPWHDEAPVTSAHAYDMASLDGKDLWLVGSSTGRDNAPQEWRPTAWRSVDNGAHWTIAHQAPDNGRYLFAATLHGALYVQQWAYSGPRDRSEIFDGTAWRDGPNLLPDGGTGVRPVELAPALGGGLLYGTRQTYRSVYPSLNNTPNQLLVFDNTARRFDGAPADGDGGGRAQVRVAFERPILDFFADDHEVVVLDENGDVWQTTDLARWSKIAGAAELHPHSVAMLDGVLYLGTDDAQLYRLRGWP